jgi:hypothetical protein
MTRSLDSQGEIPDYNIYVLGFEFDFERRGFCRVTHDKPRKPDTERAAIQTFYGRLNTSVYRPILSPIWEKHPRKDLPLEIQLLS